MSYKLTSGGGVIRVADQAGIPADADNLDWQAYQAWLAAGGVPEPADPVVLPAPVVVTMRQARLALLQYGMLAQVNTAVANMPGESGDTARIEWDFAGTVERGSPLVGLLVSELGITDSQLDDLFRLAGSL